MVGLGVPSWSKRCQPSVGGWLDMNYLEFPNGAPLFWLEWSLGLGIGGVEIPSKIKVFSFGFQVYVKFISDLNLLNMMDFVRKCSVSKNSWTSARLEKNQPRFFIPPKILSFWLFKNPETIDANDWRTIEARNRLWNLPGSGFSIDVVGDLVAQEDVGWRGSLFFKNTTRFFGWFFESFAVWFWRHVNQTKLSCLCVFFWVVFPNCYFATMNSSNVVFMKVSQFHNCQMMEVFHFLLVFRIVFFETPQFVFYTYLSWFMSLRHQHIHTAFLGHAALAGSFPAHW